MDAKLIKSDKSPIPAGFFSGIEAFWSDGQKWVVSNGNVRLFHECDSTIQQPIWNAFIADKKSLSYLSKIGLKKSSEVFDVWYKCVIGGLDNVPDILNQKFTPDSFNNMCHDTKCPHRGKLCSKSLGLKNYEVETIEMLEKGISIEKTASDMNVSFSGMKSRVEKIKVKMGCVNMAQLMAKSAELGI